MDDKQEIERKELEKEMVKVSLIDIPGAILVGLALHAKFGSNGQPLHPILENEAVVTGMFVVGGAIMLWCMQRVIAISKRRKALGYSVKT